MEVIGGLGKSHFNEAVEMEARLKWARVEEMEEVEIVSNSFKKFGSRGGGKKGGKKAEVWGECGVKLFSFALFLGEERLEYS